MDKSLQQKLYAGLPRSPYSSATSGGDAGAAAGSGSSSSILSPMGRSRYFQSGSSMRDSGAMQTPGSGSTKQRNRIGGGKSVGGQSASGRSNLSIMGIRSDCNVVECYGYQLPVLVIEALTFGEKNQSVSVMCADNGWAWVVHNRLLLVWQYKDMRRSGSGNSPSRSAKELSRTTHRRGGAIAQCRELTLPHCDIGHKASLVSVFLTEGQQMASCVAVSPTGDVRYWPSIAHDSSSVDHTGILDGQEFDQLLDVPQQNGYLLVTTTCNLVFLQLQFVNGRRVLQHKSLRQPSGFLGSFGKKLASIIIGMNSGNDKENKFVSIALDDAANEPNAVMVTVLADRWLQRWRITNNGANEQLLYEDNEIVRHMREEFQQKFWNTRGTTPDSVDINIHLLDMHITDGRIYVLAGAVNTAHTPQMYYALATLTPTTEAMRLQSFIPLKLTQFFSASTERDCLALRFILNRTHVYLYTDKVIYPVQLASPSQAEMEAEKIEFQLQDDRILTASVSGEVPLFFSRSHGLLSVTPSDFEGTSFAMDYLNGSATSLDVYTSLSKTPLVLRSDNSARERDTLVESGGGGCSSADNTNLCIFELDPDALYNEFKDEVSQLKAAFIYRLKRNNTMCNKILNEMLRSTTEGQAGGLGDVNQLDRIVITIAEDLAEDIPAADPRWEQLWAADSGNRHALGSSSSMQILTQLREKNIALRHFVEFLHSTGIWVKLTAVRSGGGNALKPTSYIISDVNEKIVAAIALRTLQNKYPKIIDEAITRVVDHWKETPHGNLTAQDIFYVRLCKLPDIFQSFADVADSRIEAQQKQRMPAATTVAASLCDINAIVLQMVAEVGAFREQYKILFTLPPEKQEAYEYLPWTAMAGSSGLRDAFTHLVEVSVRYGAHCASEPELRQRLYQQILEMVDFVLDGRRRYLESVRDTEKYDVLLQQFESQRRDLISILLDDRQYEFAAKLAEKYLDFQSLVMICDATNNQDRLDGYIKKYEEQNFSQFAINWHLQQNRQGDVFARFKGNQAALSQFMRDHPTLGWIQLVFNGDFERATRILHELAHAETQYVQRKKTMLSLAKLAALAAADSDLVQQIDEINAQLSVIEYQEQLTEHLLQSFGYDAEQQKVLKVEEIISILISDENATANEFDFHKALELLNYLESPYEMRHKIWCAAIMRDNWIEYDTNGAVDYMQSLLFFKLIELCHLMDGSIESFLPPIEDFLDEDSELGALPHDKSFQYLFKLTYEYIADAFKKSDDDADADADAAADMMEH